MKTGFKIQPGSESSFPSLPSGILHRKCACGGAQGPTGECAACRRKKERAGARSSLAISQPNDPLEIRADQLAERVMRMPDVADGAATGAGRPTTAGGTTGSTTYASTGVAERVRSLSGGRQLPASERGFFESRFGHDFRRVRVHSGAEASSLAQAVEARAFTLGSEIVFGAGEYQPTTAGGKRLLAHELAHVQQQQPTSIHRTIFRTPSVHSWAAKNSGATSSDNCCAICPVDLGVDIRPDNGFKNGIQLKAVIQGHTTGASYDIKRTKHRKISQRIGGAWTVVNEAGPGADDDSRNSDECLTPIASGSRHHIYSEDRPGLKPRSLSWADATATDAVYIANFSEFVRISDGGTTTDDTTTCDWHSVSWVTKSGGTWAMNTANSEIDIGHRASVDP